jgi:DNA replication protein DnaC
MNPPNPDIAAASQRLLESIRAKTPANTPSDHAERNRRRLEAQTEAYRQRSAAPMRHWYTEPAEHGPWGQKMAIVRKKLGNGSTIGLFGTRGAGKTQIAVEAIREVCNKGRSCLFTSACEFFSNIKSTYKADSKSSELDILRIHRTPALLVIDEVGKRGQTDWEDGLLFDLLDKRYQDESDTILTCNLDLDGFQKILGPSLLSRMAEGGGFICCDWESFRRQS